MQKEISLAPMIDVTTSNFRRFVGMTTEHTLLFTEMIVSNTIIYISEDKLKERLGEYDPRTVVQIGGSDPLEISKAIQRVMEYGFMNFNLNVGCPSSRVQKGSFGAVLMKDAELVKRIINTVYKDSGIVISLKIRTGVDDFDSYEFFRSFVSFLIKHTPVHKFYVHARKCWLKGLSPKQNRTRPDLNYEYLYMIKKEFPDIEFILNGEISSIADLKKIKNLDGAMIGRGAICNIFIFHEIEEYYKIPESVITSSINTSSTTDEYPTLVKSILKKYFTSFDLREKIEFKILLPLQNLMYGRKGCKKFKIKLNELLRRKVTCEEFLKEILTYIS